MRVLKHDMSCSTSYEFMMNSLYLLSLNEILDEKYFKIDLRFICDEGFKYELGLLDYMELEKIYIPDKQSEFLELMNSLKDSQFMLLDFSKLYM